MNLIDINQFIKDKILNRQESLFKRDIEANQEILSNQIKGPNISDVGVPMYANGDLGGSVGLVVFAGMALGLNLLVAAKLKRPIIAFATSTALMGFVLARFSWAFFW